MMAKIVMFRRFLPEVMLTLLIIHLAFELPKVSAHGRLLDPPGRSSMWRFGYNSPINYDDNALNCGGFNDQWNNHNGSCGVCGDPIEQPSPRDNELLGKYYTGQIVGTYQMGSPITIVIQLTTNHMGWFQFSVCHYTDSDISTGTEVTQKCLDQHILELANSTETKFVIPENSPSQGLFTLHYTLPKGFTCSHCFFQWDWNTASNWGVCPDGTGALGCGPQETFRSCADITIT